MLVLPSLAVRCDHEVAVSSRDSRDATITFNAVLNREFGQSENMKI